MDTDELCNRYAAQYSGAVAVVLDKRGLHSQIVAGALFSTTCDRYQVG